MDSQTFTYGVAQNLTANTFTKDGCTFKGWGKFAADTEVRYSDNASVINLITENNEELTLYAIWEYAE